MSGSKVERKPEPVATVSVRFEAALRKSTSEGIRIKLVAFVDFPDPYARQRGDMRQERVNVNLGDLLRDAGINASDVAAYMERVDQGLDVGFDS